MKTTTQAATIACPWASGCPHQAAVTPADTPWEFTVTCPVHGTVLLLSWAHAAAPPTFAPSAQPSLF